MDITRQGKIGGQYLRQAHRWVKSFSLSILEYIHRRRCLAPAPSPHCFSLTETLNHSTYGWIPTGSKLLIAFIVRMNSVSRIRGSNKPAIHIYDRDRACCCRFCRRPCGYGTIEGIDTGVAIRAATRVHWDDFGPLGVG